MTSATATGTTPQVHPTRPPSSVRRLHWLAPIRVDKGWTQEQLAEESGVAWTTIRRLEAGGGAYLKTVHRLAAALDVPSQALHAPPSLLAEVGTGGEAAAYLQRLSTHPRRLPRRPW